MADSQLGARDDSAIVGWGLTALTCLVLLVGVAIIRYTSRDQRPSAQGDVQPKQGSSESSLAIDTDQPKQPEPLVLHPMRSTGSERPLPRPFEEGIELRSDSTPRTARPDAPGYR